MPPAITSASPTSAITAGSHTRVAVNISRPNLPPSSVMLAPARYLADFARFVATRDSQERHDAAALRELEHRPLPLPPGLELEWLGVSGYRMTFERHTLFIDPYVSRVPLSAVLRREPATPDPALLDRYIGRPEHAVGVLVGHTHFDHAVDAPAISRRLRLSGVRLELAGPAHAHPPASRSWPSRSSPIATTNWARSRSASCPACTRS